jgi:hypothetical protein
MCCGHDSRLKLIRQRHSKHHNRNRADAWSRNQLFAAIQMIIADIVYTPGDW